MISRRIVFEIHRLKNRGYSNRNIARNLRIDRDTVRKYLLNPGPGTHQRSPRPSKLDPYRDFIKELLDEDPNVGAPVVLQHLIQKGFDGKITIVRDHLLKIRGKRKHRLAYCRFESAPGKQLQIDWGHFGSLDYGGTRRKLYALVAVEAYSRMLYARFTHSQKQYCLHQCLLDAFKWFAGTPIELVVDNMATAVIERLGPVVRFNEAFLDFLRIFNTTPLACNPRAPHEKGKIEAGIKYIRKNFWPLRSFQDRDDVQSQFDRWRDTVANVRTHQTTGQRPKDRFQKVNLNPLPQHLPDCRQSLSLMVHKDFAVRFDGNTYSVPPWAIGKNVTLKADQKTVSIYLKDRIIATHNRSWKRKQRVEIPAHLLQVKKLRKKLWHDRQLAAFMSLGQVAVDYLHELANAGQPVKKHVTQLLRLKDQFGSTALIYALKKSTLFKAYGADYIQNILYQQMSPRNEHPPVKLKNKSLNRIRLVEPNLADYDAHILNRRSKDD